MSRRVGGMRHVNHKRGTELVDATRVAMLTRERDLEQIAYAYPGDAWILEDEDGLCFVALGKVPERRCLPPRERMPRNMRPPPGA